MRAWLPTISIAFAAFIFVTSEFIPVGLLTEIGRTFHQSESQTGLMMTIYAWIVAGISLPLTAVVANINRRPLMLALVAIFSLAHILSVVAWNFDVLVLSRAFVAAAHAVYWAIAIPLGIRLAPPNRRDQAMSIVATGATLGSLLGIPFGTYLGQLFGWRTTFAVIGLGAALVGVVAFRVLPSTESRGSARFKTIFELFRRPKLVMVYLITVLTMTGHYTAFTFITPFLETVGGLAHERIASVLLIYGCAGLIGGFIAPRFVSRHVRGASFISLAIVALMMILFRAVAPSYAGTLVLVFTWGVAFLLFNLILQNLVLALAPDAEDVAMAGYSGIYNIGIGAGALNGSLLSVAHLGLLGFVGASCLAMAFVFCVYLLRRDFLTTLKFDMQITH